MDFPSLLLILAGISAGALSLVLIADELHRIREMLEKKLRGEEK